MRDVAEMLPALAAVDRSPRRTQVVIVAAMEARHVDRPRLAAAAVVIVERLDALAARLAGEEGIRRGDDDVSPREGVRGHQAPHVPVGHTSGITYVHWQPPCSQPSCRLQI